MKFLRIFVWLIIVALAVNVAAFAWVLNPDHLQGDQWRWMRFVIIPLSEGKMSLFEALTYEFAVLSHTHILTIGTLLLNERLFGLNLRLDTVIGVLSLFGCLALFIRHWQGRKAHKVTMGTTAHTEVENEIWVLLGMTLAASALFNIGMKVVYSWSLVTFEHIYLLMGLSLLFGFARWFSAGRLKPLIGLMIFVFILGDAMGSTAVLTTIVMAVLLTVFDRKLWKHALIYVATFAIVLIAAKLTLTGQVRHSPNSTMEFLAYAGTHPVAFFKFLFTGLGRGVFPFDKSVPIAGLNLRDWTPFMGSAIFAIATGLTLVTFLRGRFKQNTLAFLLLGFSLVGILGVMKLRLMMGSQTYIYGHRYYRFLLVFLLGTFLLAHDVWRGRPMRWLTVVASGGVVLHVLLTGIITMETWDHGVPAIKKHFGRWDAAIVEYVATGDKRYEELNRRCGKGFCETSIQYLADNELSVFRNRAPKPPLAPASP